MSNSNAHRLPNAAADQLVSRPHALLAATGGGQQQQQQQLQQLLSQQQHRHSQLSSGNSPTIGHHPLFTGQHQTQQQLRRNHHQQQASTGSTSSNSNNSNNNNNVTTKPSNYRGHQRRQSVARLLPDISKLRLLSWLVEASSELINCDIAIMDGVYAKLNRSRESLLFWSHGTQNQQRPPAPTVQPVANRLVINQQQQQQKRSQLKHKQQHRQAEYKAARNHHSLPIACSSAVAANQDATSLASMPHGSAGSCDNNNTDATNEHDLICDSNHDASDDDDSSSAASSTTSSGIHGGGTSLSSNASDSSSSSSSCTSSNLVDEHQAAASSSLGPTVNNKQQQPPTIIMSSAEQLSEKIRRTVMQHNYLQSLLVNVIRQHDRQRDLMNQQRKRQMSLDQFNLSKFHQQQHQLHQRIDLADIADSLDDGCLCSCHSQPRESERLAGAVTPIGTSQTGCKSSTLPANSSIHRASTSSIVSSPLNVIEAPARKARRTKKNRNGELNREDLINLLGDKLCENCFETHYWLHDCALELMQPPASSNGNQSSSDSNAIIARRNATFIKLVQQEVRSTLSKSIELIDLIRKEIKLPESIKQKQLMRCFSTSIQLLTSVGNYVVPAQDISSFIPEVGQSQTTLFSLPSSDFDHLLFYPMTTTSSNNHHHPAAQVTGLAMSVQQSSTSSNYHLAAAPDIPIRRRANPRSRTTSQTNPVSLSNQPVSRPLAEMQHQLVSDKPVPDSSSGASSNNSSASSSIARGTVQQSSLTRAQTSDAILDGKTSHDLSFEAIANLSRHGILFQNDAADRPKFWQSSKFNFIKKLLHVKQERLARQQSKDRRIYNNKVQNKYRLVMMDLTHFNKSQTLLTTENGVNSLLTSMRNVLEFGLYLTLKLY